MTIDEWLKADRPWNVILHGDCMELMQYLKDKSINLACVDPPYGIFSGLKNSNMNWLKQDDGGTWESKYKGQAKKWDQAPNEKYFIELNRISENQIIWGANHFGYKFDNYVVWRKLTISESFSMGMCEIASVSIKGNPKVFEKQPQNTLRFHPTQKPVALYRWLLQNYAKQGDKIIDTHSGSGSLAIACHLEKFDFLAIEKDYDY